MPVIDLSSNWGNTPVGITHWPERLTGEQVKWRSSMYLRRQRTRKQLIISILTGIGLVTLLAVLVGTMDRNSVMVATLVMTAAGLIGIWLFDSGREWSWYSEAADYLTIVGLIGFWGAFTDDVLSWVIAIVFYWGLGTLVRRVRLAR